MSKKEYGFWGWEHADAPAVTDEYKGIKTPIDLYDALSRIWCAKTCAPRMRDEWTEENMTLGQCSITAFLAQDIFGGRVYGILRPGGNYHCFNVVGDCRFDLTSEQFCGEPLDYDDVTEQFREVHFAKEEKRLRYDYLRAELKKYCDDLDNAAKMLSRADYVLIGAGAGMSTAAGAVYGGKWFEENFGDFQDKYGKGPYMRDMYSAGFYPYPSEKAYWGYWSKQCMKAGIEADHTPLHKFLLDMLKDKKVFCLSTNADGQFTRAGLPEDQIFCTQGDYFHIQCARGCHQKTYDAVDMFRQMDAHRVDCLIPEYMVPKCPVCGGRMNMNLRIDSYFVQDEKWYEAAARYENFLSEAMDSGSNICLLELGVGFNTPTIIRFPFEKLVRNHRKMSLVRLNLDEAEVPESLGTRAVGIDGDIAVTLQKLSERMQLNKSEDSEN